MGLAGEHSARGLNVLASAGTYGRCEAKGVEPIAECGHGGFGGGREIAVRQAVVTYEVYAAIQSTEQTGKGRGVSGVVVKTAPNDIFNGQAALVSEIIATEQFNHLRYRPDFFNGH